MRRRSFLTLPVAPSLNAAGRDWGVESTSYKDPVSGVEITELTGNRGSASNLYFHFSNFTADNRFVIFTSDRSGAGQIYRCEVRTGRLVQLTSDAGVLASTACPDRAKATLLYYLRGPKVMALDILSFEPRQIGEIPQPCVGGFQQPTQSGDGRFLALGKQRDQVNWEVGRLNIETGEYRTVVTQGFRIGHVQHHPSLPLIFYVWETGGYAPQRTWIVNADGSANRPYYFRTDPKEWLTPLKEWVTHESWIPGTGEMTLILDKVGILIADPEGRARLLPGDYWHVAASQDGKLLTADDNAGRLWLLEVATGNRRLLASGLRDKVRKVHAHASFDRKGEYVFFNTGRTHEAVALVKVPSF